MSQATKSVLIPTMGPRWATPRTIALVTVALAALIDASVIAVGMLTGAPKAIGDAAVVPNSAMTDSRLDDYGLRHPAPFSNPIRGTTTDSHLDDY
jgi:hypothetical protein